MIITPVRYDEKGLCVRDAIGTVVVKLPTILDFGDGSTVKQHHRETAEQIVTALNRDDGARIAELRRAARDLQLFCLREGVAEHRNQAVANEYNDIHDRLTAALATPEPGDTGENENGK